MAKIKTVTIEAESTMRWHERDGLVPKMYWKSQTMEGVIKKWASKGYRLVETTPITKTKKRFLREPVVETTHLVLTFQKD